MTNTAPKSSKKTNLQWIVAGTCLVGAVGVVVYRLFLVPNSSKAVTERAMACFQSADAGCLVSLASPREVKLNGLNDVKVKKILSQVRADFLGGATPVGPPTGEAIDGEGYSLSQTFKGGDGVTYSVSFLARSTGEGYALDNLLVSILHTPLLTLAKGDEPGLVEGFDKILRLRQISEYAESKFGDEVTGVVHYGDLGARVRPWKEIIAKYDTGLQAQGLEPLPPLSH